MTTVKFSWFLLMLTAIASVVAYFLLPASTQIPIHWNIDGQIDSYGTLAQGLFLPLAIMFGLNLFMWYLPKLEPRTQNLQQSATAKNWSIFAITVLLTIISFSNIAFAFGVEFNRVQLIFASVMVLFIIIGNFLPKTRSNFFIGIKTPWTLSNDLIWQKTHRLAGRLFMLSGILGLLGMLLFKQSMSGYVLLLVTLPSVIIPIIYSWFLWHKHRSC